MGPASISWYEKRNILFTIEMYKHPITGEETELKRYEQYAGGRLDVSCDNCRWVELGCPIMKARDWNKLHDFCDEFESDGLLTEKEFFERFEECLGRPIAWAPGEEGFIGLMIDEESEVG